MAGKERPTGGSTPRLLNDSELARSSVVANCAMNRERQLDGPNSYARELGFYPLDWLRARAEVSGGPGTWLDLCCGTGRALTQAAHAAGTDNWGRGVSIIGIDLVEYFDPIPASDSLRLICADITSWAPAPEQRFDLVTCIHGLHYVGDKLGVLTRAANWLSSDGLLIADLDAASIRLPDGRPAGRALANALRGAGFAYNARRHRITLEGGRDVSLPYAYLGADDQAGPNYTGQPAVHSYYRS